jgi:hypothetical protein
MRKIYDPSPARTTFFVCFSLILIFSLTYNYIKKGTDGIAAFFSPIGNTENIALFFPLCCKILVSDLDYY